MPSTAFGESAGRPDWRATVDGFLTLIEQGSLGPDRAYEAAADLVWDMVDRGIVDSLAELESHLAASDAIMRLTAAPVDAQTVPPGTASIDPRGMVRRPYVLGIIIGPNRQFVRDEFATYAPDPEVNMARLQSQTGILTRVVQDQPVNRAEAPVDSYEPWQQAVLGLEQEVHTMYQMGHPVEVAIAYIHASVANLVREGHTTWGAVQEFQHARTPAIFQFMARHISELEPMEGVSCRDVVTDGPREYAVVTVFGPDTLPPSDPRRQKLDDHPQNIAHLAVAGVLLQP